MDPNENNISKNREDILTKPIEVNTESTGIAQEEPIFFDPTDQQETTEKGLWKRKKKYEMPYLLNHQSSQCRVIMKMTYTPQQL